VSTAESPILAPPPDFRYIGLRAAEAIPRAWLGALIGGTVMSLGLWQGGDARPWLLGAGLSAACVVLAQRARARRARAPGACEMAIVPWGVLIESEERTRVLHWPGIKKVQIDMVHGRDQGTSTTRMSFVTIDTATERLAGRAFGGVSLERLVVHLEAYAEEASHRIGLDLDGEVAGEGPSEPDCEVLLSAVRSWLESAPASFRLELPSAGYRRASARGTSPSAIETLRTILRDRTGRAVDPRPFAAVVAAELNATELADELVELVQCPHPLVAAVAKIAARRLGVAKARAGTLEEVEPFLRRRDAETLSAWLAG
jgi:hypothetical protein